jgi:prephenate dehydratase
MRVAIQGIVGSFHHIASNHWYENLPEQNIEYIPCETFEAVFSALAQKQADQAVIAIENSLYGSISEVYDLLKEYHESYSVSIIGELSERIHQNLIVLPGSTLEKITTVFSHPVALAQSSDFLEKHLPNAQKVEYYDTAASVAHIVELQDTAVAAIGSALSAQLANLPVLHAAIENDHHNYTRFLVIAPHATAPAKSDKASLVLQTTHQKAALYTALGVFAEAGVNLTKLESRPIIGKVWKYQFYLDAEAAGEPLYNVITKLVASNCRVLLLGEYMAEATTYED